MLGWHGSTPERLVKIRYHSAHHQDHSAAALWSTHHWSPSAAEVRSTHHQDHNASEIQSADHQDNSDPEVWSTKQNLGATHSQNNNCDIHAT